MNDERVNKCQLTMVLTSGAQITIMVSLHSELASKIIKTAIANKAIAELPGVPSDEKVESDTMYVPGTSILFFALIQPLPESKIVQLDKKILIQ